MKNSDLLSDIGERFVVYSKAKAVVPSLRKLIFEKMFDRVAAQDIQISKAVYRHLVS